ncbi:MAG TPA: hypothetical protein VMV34_07660 [Terriglobia bacterium]|nr:hypothetical protein [Terriglobia bacterium]
MKGLGQKQVTRRRMLALGMFLAMGFCMGMAGRLAAAEQTTVQVVVKDAKTGGPIYQAHLTLEFRQHGGFLKPSKVVSYTGKSDKQGRCMFPVVTMGKVTLMVTAPDHETFGKTVEIKKDNQVIEVKLRRPQPVL